MAFYAQTSGTQSTNSESWAEAWHHRQWLAVVRHRRLHLQRSGATGSGTLPTTLVVGVPLGFQPQTIQAVWSGVRGSTVIIDTPATLTAIMD
jgi:hypothetical protein